MPHHVPVLAPTPAPHCTTKACLHWPCGYCLQVRWQKWQMRVGFNPREGLVLHNVGWEENGRVRPILHRASLAEMAVPYGDPK